MNARQVLIAVIVALVLALLSFGVVSPVASSHGGPMWGPTSKLNSLSSTLISGVDRTVVLTVQVLDSNEKPVPGARVIVYKGNFTFGSDSYVRPPNYQDETNADGLVRFNLVVATGEKLVLSIEATRDEVGTRRLDNLDFGTDFPTRLPLQKVHLKKRDSETATINVKFNVLDDDFDNVVDAEVKVIDPFLGESAVGTSLGGVSRGTTGSDGAVTITVPIRHTAVYNKTDFQVIASKQGYKPFQKTITLYEKDAGQTVFGGDLAIEKDTKAARDVVITVHVTDAKNQNNVVDATVQLAGAGAYSEVTDSSGTATFHVKEIGTFNISVTQSNYDAGSGSVRIRQGDPTGHAEVSLAETEEKVKEKETPRDEIDITVLWKDPADPDSRPAPLREAEVSDGRFGTPTDAAGRATLNGSYDIEQTVTVQANGYKPQSKSVRINKSYPTQPGTGNITFVLEPDVTVAPISLIVEVRDSTDPEKGIPGIRVRFPVNNGKELQATTASNGEASFLIREGADISLSQLRSGIRLHLEDDSKRYKEKLTDVTAQRLEPPTETVRETVYLERDWSELRAAVDALEQTVMAWNNDVALAGQARTLVERLANEATQAKARADDLLKEIQAAGQALNAGANGMTVAGTRCKEAARLRANIQGYKAQADANEQAIRSLLDSASGLISSCSTASDAEKIRAVYRSATDLARSIATSEQKAAKDNADIANLGGDQNDLKQIADQTAEKIAELEQLANKAQTDANTAAEYFARAQNLSKNVFARHGALRSQQQALMYKYGLDRSTKDVPADLIQRIGVMDKLLATGDGSIFGGPSSEWSNKVQEVASQIQSDLTKARNVTAIYQRDKGRQCDMTTMDDVVQEIGAMKTGAIVELADAALNEKANECFNRTKTTTTSNKPVVEDIPDAVDPGKLKPANPPPNEATNNAPTKTTTTKPMVEDIPDALDPGKPNSGNAGTTVASNRPLSNSTRQPVVEDIPDSLDPGKPKSPATNSGNKPVVEDIPDSLDPNKPPSSNGGNTTIASNRPENGSNTSTTNGNDLPPNVVRDKKGNLRPKDGYVWANPDDPNDMRVKKKPRDPNKPTKWDRFGQILGTIGDVINQNEGAGSNPSGGDSNTSGGSGSSGSGSETSGQSGPGAGGDYGDLTGTWVATDPEASDKCPGTYTMRLARTGKNTWTGSLRGSNCEGPKIFVLPGGSEPTELSITWTITGPGRTEGKVSGFDDRMVVPGEFNSSRITMYTFLSLGKTTFVRQ